MTRVGGIFFPVQYIQETDRKRLIQKKKCNYCFKESCWKSPKNIVG